jgi:hypothetical protein
MVMRVKNKKEDVCDPYVMGVTANPNLDDLEKPSPRGRLEVELFGCFAAVSLASAVDIKALLTDLAVMENTSPLEKRGRARIKVAFGATQLTKHALVLIPALRRSCQALVCLHAAVSLLHRHITYRVDWPRDLHGNATSGDDPRYGYRGLRWRGP